MSEISFRPYSAETDEGLVYKSWLNDFRDSVYVGALPRPIYYAAYREAITYLLGRGAEIVMACAPNTDPRVDTYGWICHERGFDRPCVHFMVVGRDYKGHGVERALLKQIGADDVPTYYTHRAQWSRGLTKGIHFPQLAWYEPPVAKKQIAKRFHRDERRAREDASSRQLDRMRTDRRREARDNLEETD